MIKRICDRCNNEIKGNYWIIDIYEKEDNTGRVSAKGTVNNMEQNMSRLFNRQKEYCEECIKEIKDTIENK